MAVAREGVHRPWGSRRMSGRAGTDTKETHMLRWMILVLVAGALALPMMGCEGKMDDDGASIKVDD